MAMAKDKKRKNVAADAQASAASSEATADARARARKTAVATADPGNADAKDNLIYVEATNGQRLTFGPSQRADMVLAAVGAKLGACAQKPACLYKNGTSFMEGNYTLTPGVYTYELKEKCSYHHRFGHLIVPSAQDFNTTRRIQMDQKLRNLNFRPVDAAPFLPLQLVHNVFACFLDDVRSCDLQPTQVDYEFFVRLAVVASEMLDESDFKAQATVLCQEYFVNLEIIDEMNTGALKERDSRGTATDIGARTCNAVLLLTEIKKAIYGTDADPQMQGIAKYKLHWTTRKNDAADSFTDTAYPAFLLELVGQSLKIGGLVTIGGKPDDEIGGKVCYQPLASVDLFAIHRHDLGAAEQGVKVLMALKKALDSLKNYWLDLVRRGATPDPMLDKLIHSKKLPYPLHGYGEKVEQIGDRLVYVVKGGLNKDVQGDCVVKFVQGYGTEVHAAWAKAGFAPDLLPRFKRPGGGWSCLAMELLKEEDGWKCLGQLEAEVADALRPQVLESLDKAHEVPVLQFKDGTLAYGVHGDMRDANVMVLLDGDELKDVKFIDFDWAKMQHARNAVYPGFMNLSVNWPAGVEAGKPMLQEHDKLLLQQARNQQLKGFRAPEDARKHDVMILEQAEMPWDAMI